MGAHLDDLIKAYRGLNDAKGAAEAEQELARFRASDPAIVALDARLAAVLKGNESPKDNTERLQLAQRAYDKALHSSATRLWIEALAADPRLTDDRRAQHRYNAACAAALAGNGQGKDDPTPDDAAKAKLRAQALAWLTDELAAWTRLLKTAESEKHAGVVQTLRHWQEDADLAGVRDAKAIEALPETEREGWRTLWTNVAEVLARGEKR
jgi:hypothetical protein